MTERTIACICLSTLMFDIYMYGWAKEMFQQPFDDVVFIIVGLVVYIYLKGRVFLWNYLMEQYKKINK